LINVYGLPVIRFILSLLCVLGLAFSPVATNVARANPAEMAECTMDQSAPARSSDDSQKSCCTPACQLAPAAALLPEPSSRRSLQTSKGAERLPDATKELASFRTSGLDPPPRTIFS